MVVEANNTETSISVIWNGARSECNEGKMVEARFLTFKVRGYRQAKEEGYNTHVIMDRLYFLNLKNFSASKSAIQKVKIQPKEGKKICAGDVSDKSVLFRIHQQLLQNHQQQKDN